MRPQERCGELLRGRRGVFVVETDMRYPTDFILLMAAMHCLLRVRGRAAHEHDVAGWRRWRHLA